MRFLRRRYFWVFININTESPSRYRRVAVISDSYKTVNVSWVSTLVLSAMPLTEVIADFWTSLCDCGCPIRSAGFSADINETCYFLVRVE